MSAKYRDAFPVTRKLEFSARELAIMFIYEAARIEVAGIVSASSFRHLQRERTFEARRKFVIPLFFFTVTTDCENFRKYIIKTGVLRDAKG